jgi:outer membrane protein
VTVAVDTLANRERHLGQVEAFVEVGTQPEIALAQARADRANAQYQLITAQNGYETTKAQLNQAMGVEGPTDYDVSDEMLPPMLGEDQDTQALLDEALAARPEMAAAAEAVRAQELLVKANRAEYLPTVSASTGFTDAGTQVSNLVWNWNAALNVSVPIFRGGQTGAQLQVARWQLEGLKAQADILRQQIRLDVDQARLAVRAAKAALSSADDALVNAREQLRLAEGRYETGVGNIIELDDAQVALTSAAQQKVQAEYNLASARAQLLRAVGRS